MTARNVLFEFVLDRAAHEPAHRRVALYRALAEIAGDPAITKELRRLADDLEAADHRCQEFTFKYQQGGAR